MIALTGSDVSALNTLWKKLSVEAGLSGLSFGDNFGQLFDTTTFSGGSIALSGSGAITGVSSLTSGSTLAANIKGNIADTGGTAVKIGNVTSLTSGKIIGFYSDALTTEKAYIDFAGRGYYTGLYADTFGANTATFVVLKGSVADGAGVTAVKIGNVNALVTSGAKIVSFYNDNIGTEKAFIDKDGGPTFNADLTQRGNIKFDAVTLPAAPVAATVGAVAVPAAAVTAASVGAVTAPGRPLAAAVSAVTAPGACTAAVVTAVTAPGACVATVDPGVGLLSEGNYYYKLVYVTAYGTTDAGTASNAVYAPTLGRVVLTSLPVSSDSRVTSRKLYRTEANGSTYKLVATLDASSKSYLDNKADLDLGATAPSASTAVSGSLSVGAYSYKVTYVTADGETEASVASGAASVTDAAVDGRITVSSIPVSLDSRVTGRKLYRTVHDGVVYKLLVTINDNTTVTYADNIADGSLGVGTAPATNTAVGGLLSAGNYFYKVSYVTAAGQTLAGLENIVAATVTTSASNGKVNVTGIPVSADARVTGKKLYRTEAGGVAYKLLASISNATVTYADNIADISLGAAEPVSDTAVSGNLETGSYDYVMTYVTAVGETTPGAASGAVAIASPGADGKINVTVIPVSADSRVTGKKLYRTDKTGVAPYLYLATLAVGDTSYVDNIADAGLGAAAPIANTGGAGNVDNGNHLYKVSFTSPTGETVPSAASGVLNIADKTNDGVVTVTYPISSDPNVTGRKLYRTLAAGSTYYLLTTISNNISTSFTDNVDDATILAGGVTAKAIDISGGGILGDVSNAADSIALKIGNVTSLAAAGAKILALYSDNFVTEKFSVNKDGGIVSGAYSSSGTVTANAFTCSNTTTALITSSTAVTGGVDVGFTLNTANALGSIDTLVSFKNNSVEKCLINGDGNFFTNGNVQSTTGFLGTTKAIVLGTETTSGTAIACQIGNINSLSTGGDKVCSFYKDNVTTEVAYIDYLGNANFDGNVYATKGYLTDSLSVKGNIIFDPLAAPGAPTVALAGVVVAPTAPAGVPDTTAGGLSAGDYKYIVTFITGLGESLVSAASASITAAVGKSILLTFDVSTDPRVTGRNIYRTEVGPGATYYLVTTIANNIATTYVDGLDDIALALKTPAPAVDTSGNSNLDDNNYYYKISYLTGAGETYAGTASAMVTVADHTADGWVKLSNIPVSGDSRVTARKIYRTEGGGSTYKYLTVINNNASTEYYDSIADGSLTVAEPSANTTSAYFVDKITFSATDETGSPGDVAINRPAGKAAIATGVDHVHVTNSFVTANSIVMITPLNVDATLINYSVVPGAGAFVVTGNAVATANWGFMWFVIN